MQQSSKVDRIRGTNDLLPATSQTQQHLQTQLVRCFESFGYVPIDVPILEYTDLLLRKSGSEIISRLYEFTYRNRQLCLRPELTASVVRAYVDQLQMAPSPLRLYYAGPVFRYEKPQWGRYRQFTQVGVELFGAAEAMADAEVIYLAHKGLNQLRLTEHKVVIGHVGILGQLLENLEIEGRLRQFLMVNMEILRRDGAAQLIARLGELYPGFEPVPAESGEATTIKDTSPHAEQLMDLLRPLERSQAQMVLRELLDSMNVNLAGSRSPDEIVDRLLTKLLRPDLAPRINRALEFMRELGQLVGEPAPILEEAHRLLAAYELDPAPLEQLKDIMAALSHYPLEMQQVELDLGLSRGLQYYTGTIFELWHTRLDIELGGGGRYDDLVMTLGGSHETPAVGFAYGLERLRLVLEEHAESNPIPPIAALVIPVTADEYGYAIRVAEQLRAEGLHVEVNVRERSVKAHFKYANKRNIAFAVVVGSTEQQAQQVTLKDLLSQDERQLTIGEAAQAIKQKATTVTHA